MNRKELESKHPDYLIHSESWKFYRAAYEGTKALLDYGVVKRLTDESNEDYAARLKTIFGFNLSERLIDLVIGYLFSKPTYYDFESLKNDKLFNMFIKNCDKQGNNFEDYMQNQMLISKVYGYVGLLINKAKIDEQRTIEMDALEKIYPYITSFSPLSIYDWTYELINGAKSLTYLKLFDDTGCFNLWWPDRWEIWATDDDKEYVLHDSGINNLGIIPFVVLKNDANTVTMGGTSDIKEVARHDSALINNAHSANEIIAYNGFPMLQVPDKGQNDSRNIKVEPRAVLEYDRKFPESKASWLSTEVSAPITAIIEWNEIIILEAYKSISASFMNDNGSGVESGEAKKRAFQSFNSSLAKSASALQQAELNIIDIWLMWQDNQQAFESISISRTKNYDIQSLSDDLDNFTAAMQMVKSETFNQEVQKTTAGRTLPDLSRETSKIIDDEINAASVEIDLNDMDSANDELENE